MLEVRFHGRGGQGAVTAAKILAAALVSTGRYGASFPMFGFERRGPPVVAFGRFGDEPMRLKTQIYLGVILISFVVPLLLTLIMWGLGVNAVGIFLRLVFVVAGDLLLRYSIMKSAYCTPLL